MADKVQSSLMPILDHFGVDMIYVVNLPGRVDRLLRLDRQLREASLPYQLIDGVEGARSFSCEAMALAMQSLQHGQRRSSEHIKPEHYATMLAKSSAATVGYMQSQKKIFEDAIKCGYQNILVLDDDIILNNLIQADMESISQIKDYKIFLPGCSEYANRYEIDFLDEKRDLYHPVPGKTCGSFAVIYNQAIFKEILDLIDEYAGTYDNCVLGSIYARYPRDCYAKSRALVLADVSDSDIREGRDQAAHSRTKNWDLEPWHEYSRPVLISVILTNPDLVNQFSFPEQHLGKNVFVNFHMPTELGLRPFHPASMPFSWRERQADRYECACAHWSSLSPGQLESELLDASLPYSELAIVWRERSLAPAQLMETLAHILRDKGSCGMEGRNIWARSCGKRPVPDLHSVIIPTVRGLAEILPSVRSALDQTAENVEVILVNDNPHRRIHPAHLRNCLLPDDFRKGKHLRVINHPRNLNASAARNSGLLASNGEYISFLDDDDVYLPKRLERAFQALQARENRQAGAVYCAWSKARSGEELHFDRNRLPNGKLQREITRLEYGSHYLNMDTITFHRDFLMAINGFDEYFERHQDIELMTRFFQFFPVGTSAHVGVRLKPTERSGTFNFTYDNLLKLKIKYLNNFRNIFKTLDLKEREELVQAHVADIMKNFSPDASLATELALRLRAALN